ncbi:hypothetical protein [Pedobacter caeni]|uniref:Uncharacterized protein n=1 Tax=Pedobacter caeni TaxID=288992 RepID=A0A1M5C0G8_9SPHI|nr:hypothetical protein [Pedobacter caeni]SHF48284.1 hypothetical protein SAMN04488522_1021442 [Pedobacter caeni]
MKKQFLGLCLLMFGSGAYAQQIEMTVPGLAAQQSPIFTARTMESEQQLPLGRYFLVDLSDLKPGKSIGPAKFNGRTVSMEEVFMRKWTKDNVQEFVFFGDNKDAQNLILLLPRNLTPQTLMAADMMSNLQNCNAGGIMMPRMQMSPVMETVPASPVVKAND